MKTLYTFFIIIGFSIFSNAQIINNNHKNVIGDYCTCIENINNSKYININALEEQDCMTKFFSEIKRFKLNRIGVTNELKQNCNNSAAFFLLSNPKYSLSDIFENININNILDGNIKSNIDQLDYLSKFNTNPEFKEIMGMPLTSIKRDSLAIIYFSKGKELLTKTKIQKAKKILIKAFNMSSSKNYIRGEIIEIFLKLKEYDIAEKLLSRISITYSDHLLLSQHYFHLGLVNVKKDWESLKKAFSLFLKANYHMNQAKVKDLELWSDILNAIGYTSITGRGLSKYNNNSDPFCIQHLDYFKVAYPYFVWSLKYNSENEAAIANRDTLLNIFQELNINEPIVDYHQMPDPDTSSVISLDSIDLKKINERDSIIYDAKLLPENYQRILNLLNLYDEIVLVLDFSGSMKESTIWSDGVSKFSIMHNLAKYLVKNIKEKSVLGVISVGNTCNPADGIFIMSGIAQKSRVELINDLSVLSPLGSTPLNKRLKMTPYLFSGKNNKKTVFLISDGMDVCDQPFDVCGTASFLNDHDIDFSLFSYILESEEDLSRYAYEIYECMVQKSKGKIFHVDEKGAIQEKEIDKLKNELKLILPRMVKSTAWKGHDRLYQFDINSIFGK